MTARHKLNQAHFNGILVVAAAIAGVAQSWTIFWLTISFLAVGSLHGGDIRLGATRRQR